MGGCNEDRPRRGWLFRDQIIATGQRDGEKRQGTRRLKAWDKPDKIDRASIRLHGF
jgi:hypothetical protein